MASAAIIAKVKAIPEFAALDDADATLEAAVDLAVIAHSSTPWGAVYVHAMAFYAAHLLKTTFADDDGEGALAAGGVTSKKARDLSEGYGAAASGSDTLSDRILSTTRYGRQYVALKRTRAAGRAGIVSIGL